MGNTLTTILLKTSAGVFLLVLSACVTLAPAYDKAIVDGLTSANHQLMELFASTSTGTSTNTFDKREKQYNTIIGGLDALAIQAVARPVPKTKTTQKVNEALEKRGAQILDGDDAPSAVAIQEVSETIVKMRDTDRKQGVTSLEVAAFKGQTIIFLDQAITYENFLKR